MTTNKKNDSQRNLPFSEYFKPETKYLKILPCIDSPKIAYEATVYRDKIIYIEKKQTHKLEYSLDLTTGFITCSAPKDLAVQYEEFAKIFKMIEDDLKNKHAALKAF